MKQLMSLQRDKKFVLGQRLTLKWDVPWVLIQKLS